MSKLEKLIERYCPDGVEWKPLKAVLKIKNGRDYKHLGKGPIPVYGSGGIMTYVNVPMYTKPSVLIQRKGSIDKLYYADIPFWNVDTVFYTEMDTAQVVEKYVYYVLQKEHLERLNTAGGVPSLTQSVLNEVLIPVPPLPVQEEIVRVLDAFTELQAELQKRLQQYEYYKWNIFEGLSCPTKHITDVALVKARVGWQRLTTAEYQETGDYYLITGTDFKNGKIDFNSCVFVSKERYEMDPNIIVGKGDILITKDGTLGKVAFMTEEPNKPTTLNSGVFRIHTTEPQVSSRYLFHYFTSKYFTDFVNSVKTGSTIPHLTQQGLVSLNIPIPSLEEQNRVVSILDKFEALTTDLTQGLPAEMEKRRQQYEFYRDKLLTFKRKEA